MSIRGVCPTVQSVIPVKVHYTAERRERERKREVCCAFQLDDYVTTPCGEGIKVEFHQEGICVW